VLIDVNLVLVKGANTSLTKKHIYLWPDWWLFATDSVLQGRNVY